MYNIGDSVVIGKLPDQVVPIGTIGRISEIVRNPLGIIRCYVIDCQKSYVWLQESMITIPIKND